MAIPKSDEQKQINKDIQKINPNIKAFTEKDFSTNNKLKELLSIYLKDSERETSQKNNLVPDISEEIYIKMIEDVMSDSNINDFKESDSEIFFNNEKRRKELLSKLSEKDPNNNVLYYSILDDEIFNKTAEFFGLTHNPIIYEIMDVAYVKAIDIQLLDEHEYQVCKILKVRNLEGWAKFCKSVDQMKIYIEEIYPNWNQMKKSEKQKYINSLNVLSKQPFMNDTINLKYLINFLTNYGLNQTSKFKAKYLFLLKLPNVKTLDIALKITNNSNLKIFVK